MSRPERIPNLFLVGAGKSGTTALWEYLRVHPDVFMSDPKEPHFFGHDFPIPDGLPTTLSQYLSCFEGVTDEKVVGEASTSYLWSSTAATEIHGFNPAAKIVVIFRNPVDVMHSLHSMYVHALIEPIGDFEEAIKHQGATKDGSIPPWRNYRDVVRYADQLGRYLQIFAREQIHVALYDDLKSDPDKVYRDLLRFLDVEETMRPEAFGIANANRRLRSPAIKRFVQNPPRPIRALARSLISAESRTQIAQKVDEMITVQESRPQMSESFRKRLTENLREEIGALGEMIDRDLTAWTR